MKIYCLILHILLFYLGVGKCLSQGNTNLKGSFYFDASGGFRANLSSHSTPQLSFNGLIAGAGGNDRIILAPAWNVTGALGYEFLGKPIMLGIKAGVQVHENVHFAGIYRWNDDFKPKRINFKTIVTGIWGQYDFLNTEKQKLGIRFGFNFLFFPQNRSNFKEGYGNNYGRLISKNEQDTIDYITVINSISTANNISFQFDLGLNYKYFLSNSIFVQLTANGQLGITNLLNSSAVFINSTNPDYTGNSSFSVNKGDGFCINAGIGYRLPIKGKAKRI